LLQTLSNVNSPALLSSSKVASALEKAPARDIVQLGASSSDPLTNLENLPAQSASSTSSPTDQLAAYQATLQAVQTQDLFGTGTANALSSSLLNLNA
jgi:hypothetical protein